MLLEQALSPDLNHNIDNEHGNNSATTAPPAPPPQPNNNNNNNEGWDRVEPLEKCPDDTSRVIWALGE